MYDNVFASTLQWFLFLCSFIIIIKGREGKKQAAEKVKMVNLGSGTSTWHFGASGERKMGVTHKSEYK